MNDMIDIHIVHAFVDGDKGGNPAGVMIEGASALSVNERQEVARQVGLSETAFVLPSSSADIKLEFYTPTSPIAHCGHATVGSFAVLNQKGHLATPCPVNETVDGPRKISIDDEGRVFLEQIPARFVDIDESMGNEILASLGLERSDILPGGEPIFADSGNGIVLIAVKNREILSALKPDMARVDVITRKLDTILYYVFTLEGEDPTHDASVRMFAPAIGIDEEAATGMAAGPLACWLDRHFGGERKQFIIEQGRLMAPSSPSIIIARPERNNAALCAMWVGGSAQVKATKSVTIDRVVEQPTKQ